MNMLLFVLVSLIGFVFGLPPRLSPKLTYYHETVGIKRAALIKAAEEAADFDGSRIVGGSPAFLGQYPYLGGLLISLTTGETSMCGSTLLTNTKAVTAAHCWYDGQHVGSELTIVLGSLTLYSGGTRITSSNVFLNDYWNPYGLQNDIAIITISWVNYSNIIRNIGLPSGSLLNNNFVGVNAQAAGFGRVSDWENIGVNQHLHHVTLRVIANSQCQGYYGGSSSIIYSVLCTDGSEGRSTCTGDSGGPLTINSGGQDILIGVTAFGPSWGCSIGFPAGFTRVTAFIPWIESLL